MGKQAVSFINQEKKMNKLLNWSELSRYITKGDRNGIRFGKIPKKHINALDKLLVKITLIYVGCFMEKLTLRR